MKQGPGQEQESPNTEGDSCGFRAQASHGK